MFDRCKNYVYSELKNNWLVWTIALIVFFLMLLVIYESRGHFTTPKKLEYTAASQNYKDATVDEMADGATVTQTFVSKRDSFSRIQMPFHTPDSSGKPHGTLDLAIKESGSGKLVFQKKMNLNQIKGGELNNFDFPKITGAKGKKYELIIKSSKVNKKADAVVWKSTGDHYKQGQLTINGRNVPGDLRFAIYDVEGKILISKSGYVLAADLFLLLFVLSIPALRKYKNEMHKAFLVTAIPVGLMLAIVMPPFDQLDEFDHFLRSFETSEGMFLNHETQHQMGNYIPVSLVDTVYKTQFISGNGYQYGIAHEAFQTKLNPSDRIFIRNYASSYPPTIYIPQAIGVTLGRYIFDSPMMMMYLGRIFNFLAYAVIVYTALKIVPVKKNLFYLMALLPMAMNQAATLSGDSMLISSAMLFVAYILYLAYGKVEQIKLKHVLTTIGIGIFIAASKMVYIPMILLFLIIPLKKFSDKKDFWKKFLYVLAGFMIPYLVWNALNFANISIPDVRNHVGVMPKDQIKFILTQPVHFLKILADSVLSMGENRFLGMLGRVVVIYHYVTPHIVIYTYLFMLILFGLWNNENDLQFFKLRNLDKWIMMFIMLSSVLLIYVALYVGYSPVGNSSILGVQGRYFLPVAIFLFLSISSPLFINKSKHLNFLVYTIIHCCLYVALLSYLLQINSY